MSNKKFCLVALIFVLIYSCNSKVSESTAVDSEKLVTIDTSSTTNQNTSPKNQQGTFTDNRDGKTYKWVKIGNQTWMAENLAFNVSKGSFSPLSSTDSLMYGRLYDWKAAKAACPDGWHLPSDAEFKELLSSVAQKGISYEDVLVSSGFYTSSPFSGGEGSYLICPNLGFQTKCKPQPFGVDKDVFHGSGFWSSDRKEVTKENEGFKCHYFHLYKALVATENGATIEPDECGYPSQKMEGLHFCYSIRCIKDVEEGMLQEGQFLSPQLEKSLVYASPAISAQTVKQIEPGELVTVMEGDSGVFVKVSYNEDGKTKTGWVNRSQFKVVEGVGSTD